MTLTEEEAKKRWCPEARAASQHGPYNRQPGSAYEPPGTRCMASQCMAWRWADVPVGVEILKESALPGYCGKAGRP